jgi:hypothetical protein
MQPSTHFSAACFVFLIGTAACGGTVVESTGSFGSQTTITTGGTTTTVSTGGTTTTSTDPMDLAIGAACNTDDDCAPGSFCDQATGVCTALGTVAVGGVCNDDRDCDPGDACDPNGLTCVAAGLPGSVATGGACVDDAECDLGDYCTALGTCAADPYASDEGSEPLGALCFEDADCDSGDYCDLQTDTCVN